MCSRLSQDMRVRCNDTACCFSRFWQLAVSAALLGFSMTPVLPISLELACEITFPVGESTSSGLLMANGQVRLLLPLQVEVNSGSRRY
jgi:hypothetical protein